MTLKGENTLLKRRTELLVHDHDQLVSTIWDREKEIERLKRKILAGEESIVSFHGNFYDIYVVVDAHFVQESLRKEVDERNFTIGQKETRILEIKQKNQELEKYRFVLDFKINELKEELSE